MELLGFGFNLMSTLFPVIFIVVFLLVIGIIISSITKSFAQKRKDDQSPRLTVDAVVVGKREEVSTHHHNTGTGTGHTHRSTAYYVTFEVESGDRMELKIPRDEVGYIIEGDRGKLTFQGSRFLGFERY